MTLRAAADSIRSRFPEPWLPADGALSAGELLRSEPVRLYDVTDPDPLLVGRGKLVLTADSLRVSGITPWSIPMADIRAEAVDLKRRLNFSSRRRVFEVVMPRESVIKWELFLPPRADAARGADRRPQSSSANRWRMKRSYTPGASRDSSNAPRPVPESTRNRLLRTTRGQDAFGHVVGARGLAHLDPRALRAVPRGVQRVGDDVGVDEAGADHEHAHPGADQFRPARSRTCRAGHTWTRSTRCGRAAERIPAMLEVTTIMPFRRSSDGNAACAQ